MIVINDEKYCSGRPVPISKSMEYFGCDPEELLNLAWECKIELYVYLTPFTAKLTPHRMILSNPKKAERSTGAGDYVPLLPSYALQLLNVGEAEVKVYESNVPDDEVIYFWVLDVPQKVDISRIRIYSEHIERVDGHIKAASESKMIRQEEMIISCLLDLGYDPKKLPMQTSGLPGVKSKVKNVLMPNSQTTSTFTIKSFDKAWERLRSSRRIGENQ